jgi:hypothetical protein
MLIFLVNYSFIHYVDLGSIICSVDPDMAASVYLESLSSKSTRANITIVSSSFEAINDQSSNNNNMDSDIVTNLGVITGRLTGKHANNNPLNMNKKSNNSGKIDQTGAQLQSLRTLVSLYIIIIIITKKNYL